MRVRLDSDEHAEAVSAAARDLGPSANPAVLQDPLSAAKLAGCIVQFCYLDDVNAYATNEITINWNSALSWVSAFLADQRNGTAPA